MSRVLIVANQTLGGQDLLEHVRRRMEAGDLEVSLLVPATARADRHLDTRVPGINVPLDTEDDDYAAARKRLEHGLESLRSLGATVDGTVGHSDPMRAIQEVLARGSYDEIIVSTLPSAVSRWLRQDLPHKVERKFHLPVTVVTAGQGVSR